MEPVVPGGALVVIAGSVLFVVFGTGFAFRCGVAGPGPPLIPASL